MPVAESRGARIHYTDAAPAGEASAEALVLVMGLGGTGAAWWRLLPHVEPHVRVLAMDNRGTGASSRLRGPLWISDMVADVLAVLDDAGVERAHVFGTSMGGIVAQHLALDHRERVASLLLGSTTACARSGAPPWRLLSSSLLRPLVGVERSWPLVARALYAERTHRERPDLVAEDCALRTQDATPTVTIGAQLAAIALHDVRSRLPELEGLGVTVLHGDEDRLIAPARGRALALAIPGARFVMIPGCGHLTTTDAEEPTARAVLEHLARHGASRAQAA